MEAWVVQCIERFGYMGVWFLIAVENLFPPIPSELILTFSGFLTSKTSLHLPGVVIASTMGAVLGSIALYILGGLLGKRRISRIVEKHGRLLGLDNKKLEKAYGWFDRSGGKAVFFCRMVPLLRSLISIPAGMAQMRMLPFLALTTTGSLIWNTLLAGAGALLGESWEEILRVLNVYSSSIGLLLGAAAFFIAIRLLRNLRRARRQTE